MRWVFGVLLIGALVAGCGATSRPRATMERVESGVPSVPAGKAMVVFHRPSSWYHDLVVELFDGTKLVAQVTGKQTTYYICDPGKHHFIARSGSVWFLEANVSAGQIYDVVLDIHRGWYGVPVKYGVNIRMAPLIRGNKRRPRVPEWLANTPIYRVAEGSDVVRAHEEKRLEANKAAIHDFTLGEKTGRVVEMGPDDHR